MKTKHFLFAILLFACQVISAQVVRSPSALRALQTANTLMEAKQYYAAEDYFKSALEKAILRKDLYCQAAANEGLGNLYSKLEQTQKAVDHYNTAIKLYKRQNQYVVVAVLENLLKSAQGIGDVFAGIEIGAKGVKLSVIEVKLSIDREYGYTLLMDTAINTDAASLSYQSEVETSNTLALLMKIIKDRFQIPPSKIYAVIASGLKQELDKYKKVNYFSNIIRPAEMDSSIAITSITPGEEAELSVLGIVPEKHRFSASQLDVGSGNTKGGFFNNNKDFVPFTYPLGTKSFQRLIGPQADISTFANTAEQIWTDSLSAPMSGEFADISEIKTKDIVYLSGGIVWSIVSLLHPESAYKSYTEISPDDIADFRQHIVTNYSDVINPRLTSISSDPTAVNAVNDNLRRVLKTYDQKAMTAGAIWLNRLVHEMISVNPSKKFIYYKYAYVGWISGYIMKKVTNQFVRMSK